MMRAKALPYRRRSLTDCEEADCEDDTSLEMQSRRPLPRRVEPTESSHWAKLSGPCKMIVLYEERSSSLSDIMNRVILSSLNVSRCYKSDKYDVQIGLSVYKTSLLCQRDAVARHWGTRFAYHAEAVTPRRIPRF